MRARGRSLKRGKAQGASTLIVDDSPERLAFFQERLPGCVVATNYAGAVAALRRRRFRTLFLDFDLGASMNGTDLSFWLVRNLPAGGRPRVVLHSTNLGGALSMQLTLGDRFDVKTEPFPPRCLEVDSDGEPNAVPCSSPRSIPERAPSGRGARGPPARS